MKKIHMIIMAVVVASLLGVSVPAYAKSKGGDNPCAKNPCAENPCAEKVRKHAYYKGDYDKDHHAAKLEMMEMLRETMAIVKGLNHKPTEAEKKKLGVMIDRLTEIEKKCKERKKECATKYKDKKTKWRDKEAKEGKAHGE